MKTIATINFKGGVGKTTVTWCLGDVLSQYGSSKSLLFDLDAQMSLTQAISLDDEGNVRGKFDHWQEKSRTNRRTIFAVLYQFLEAGHFDFHLDKGFVYRLRDNYDFVPSTEQLYWLELGRLDPGKGKFFIKELLGSIENSKILPKYDYVLFDCPPSFTLLSYSVLTCCDLILVPVNPDFFAAKGVDMLLAGLKEQVKPSPLPAVMVFANRVRTYSGEPTKAASRWILDTRDICDNARSKLDIDVRYLDSWIPDRAAIRDAITNRETPKECVEEFTNLWKELGSKLL